ncbi:MAG: cytochrome-c peroxidase [Hyphomicrobiales bacterium]|nr:cytochrome-c peroxidase [Hyphomicrobiales bacterium]
MIRVLLVALLAFAAPVAAADGPVAFTDDELAMVLAHGPWPPAVEKDPSNRVSGDPRAAALGETLFFDTALSADGTVACATCHRPDAAFADGRATGRGLQDLTRNTPSLVNARWQRWYGWDGGADPCGRRRCGRSSPGPRWVATRRG